MDPRYPNNVEDSSQSRPQSSRTTHDRVPMTGWKREPGSIWPYPSLTCPCARTWCGAAYRATNHRHLSVAEIDAKKHLGGGWQSGCCRRSLPLPRPPQQSPTPVSGPSGAGVSVGPTQHRHSQSPPVPSPLLRWNDQAPPTNTPNHRLKGIRLRESGIRNQHGLPRVRAPIIDPKTRGSPPYHRTKTQGFYPNDRFRIVGRYDFKSWDDMLHTQGLGKPDDFQGRRGGFPPITQHTQLLMSYRQFVCVGWGVRVLWLCWLRARTPKGRGTPGGVGRIGYRLP